MREGAKWRFRGGGRRRNEGWMEVKRRGWRHYWREDMLMIDRYRDVWTICAFEKRIKTFQNSFEKNPKADTAFSLHANSYM